MAETKEAMSFPFIEGSEIILCPPNMENINLYTKWMNSPETRKYARYEFPVTVEESKKFLESGESRVKPRIMFEIWHKKDQKRIGYCEIDDISWVDHRAHLGITIGEIEYWGKGIGTETIKVLTEYSFNELNFHKIAVEVLTPNKGSQRCFEKNGFKYEGKLKEDTYVDGEFIDLLKYCLLKDDWLKIKKQDNQK